MKRGDVSFITLGIVAMGLAFTTTDIYVPALPAIQHYFSVPINQVQYTLTTYLFGLAIAQVTAGPIVDHLGHRKIFLPSLIAFILVTFFCMFSPNIITLIIMRTFQALLAGVIGITAKASFVRRFSAEQTAHIFMTLAPTIILSGIIAPIIGGYIVYYVNWQDVFLFLACYSAALLWASYRYFYVNEEKPQETSLHVMTILKNYITILKHKQFVQCILMNGIYLGVIFSYLTEAPFIYHAYGYTASQIGLTFIPIALAFLLASQLTRFLRKRFLVGHFVILAFGLIMIGLCVMAIPAFYQTGLAPMIAGITIVIFGTGFTSPVAFGKGMVLFPTRSGTASSLLTALPFIAGTLLTLLVHPLCGGHIGLLALFLAVIATASVAGYYILGLLDALSVNEAYNND